MERKSKTEKQSNPKTLSRCRSLTDSRTLTKSLHLFNNSPRNLMYSLQHKRSPSEGGFGAWKVRNNDFAVEEILRERREAIESGKLKGRKLFDTEDEEVSEIDFCGWDEDVDMDADVDADVDGEVRSIFFYDSDDEKENIVENQQQEYLYCESGRSGLCSPSFSCSSSSSYVCDECMEKEIVAVEEEKEVVASVAAATEESKEEEEKKSGVNGGCGFKGWVVIGLSVCVIGVISFWRIGDYGDTSNEVMFLVPT